MAPEKWLALFSLSILILAIILFESLKPRLFDSSASLSQSIQESSLYILDVMFLLISYTSLIGTAALVVLCYVEVHPVSGLILIVLYAGSTIAQGILKLAFSEPRPYWAYEGVRAVACDKGWGTPSGHTMFTGVLWGIVIYQMWKSKWRLWTSLIFLALLTVGFDRVYLGVHFYSQVLLGWAFAFAIVMVTGLYYRKLHQSFGTMQWKWVTLAHCFALFLYLIALLFYETRAAFWDDNWTLQIRESAAAPELLDATAIFLMPGALLGYKWLLNSELKDWWAGGIYWKRILRVSFGAVPIVLFEGMSTAYIEILGLSLSSLPGGAILAATAAYISGVLLTYCVPRISASLNLNREQSEFHLDPVHEVSLQLTETQMQSLGDFMIED